MSNTQWLFMRNQLNWTDWFLHQSIFIFIFFQIAPKNNLINNICVCSWYEHRRGAKTYVGLGPSNVESVWFDQHHCYHFRWRKSISRLAMTLRKPKSLRVPTASEYRWWVSWKDSRGHFLPVRSYENLNLCKLWKPMDFRWTCSPRFWLRRIFHLSTSVSLWGTN